MKWIYIILTLLILTVSCKKNNELTLAGKWVLVDGFLYVQDMETGQKVKYEHFGNGKTVSQLTGFNLPNFEFERIEQNVTTWEFKPNRDFILNDNYAAPLYCQITGEWYTLTENPNTNVRVLGGSARPFTPYTYDYKNKIIAIQIQNQVGSLNGRNIEWYNLLIFKFVKASE
jgi:hypothetical protein